jgi:plastocyanin
VSRRTTFVAGVALASVVLAAYAAEHVVAQKDKRFSVQKLRIKVGESITFRNDDPYFHNIFSLSSARSFDLGSFPKGESRSVTFDKVGTVEVECAIHPEMKMTVEVAK